MERLRLLSGGPKSEWPSQLLVGTLAGPWVAADRGAIHLLQMGQIPLLVVGDFDSINQVERHAISQRIPAVITKDDVDDTDTQWILNLIEQRYQPDALEIYGATGGRIDQFLSNLFIFTEARFRELATRTKLIDRNNVIQFFLPGEHTIVHEPTMKYLGFMALEPVTGLNLPDEKYNLSDWSGNPWSFSSNEFKGTVNHFSFTSGMVAVIQSKDTRDQNPVD
ncbi:MAG: thiamine diphosphokinase [Lactobacillaceae bacterium]|jgi:thiamine pyrophosphokinase|nr:thiamine diphosphokinase [Lactobacillaceae bacterium]